MQNAKPCYDTAESNLLARFETEAQGVYALPYSYLLCAVLSPNPRDGTGETLTLLYVSHTVTIRGDRLSSLLLVFQKGRAEAVRVGGGQPNGTTNAPAVREITVAEGPNSKL